MFCILQFDADLTIMAISLDPLVEVFGALLELAEFSDDKSVHLFTLISINNNNRPSWFLHRL